MLGGHAVYSQTGDTQTHPSPFAGDTAAQCLSVKKTVIMILLKGPPVKDFAAHVKTLTSMLESHFWECGAFLLPGATSDFCCRHFCSWT